MHSCRNLAIVFGPNLIRAKVETVQCALEMPLLQGIVQILIEHSDIIWDESLSTCRNTMRPLSTIFVGKDLTRLSQAVEAFDSLPVISSGKKPPPLPPPRSTPIPNNRASLPLNPPDSPNSVKDRMRVFEPKLDLSEPISISAPSTPSENLPKPLRSLSSNNIAATKTKLNSTLNFTLDVKQHTMPPKRNSPSQSPRESPRKPKIPLKKKKEKKEKRDSNIVK